MEPVRFGLVGYGFGGRWFHAPLLAAAPECTFLGVVTGNPERRALVRRGAPGAAAVGFPGGPRRAGAPGGAVSPPPPPPPAPTPPGPGLGAPPPRGQHPALPPRPAPAA